MAGGFRSKAKAKAPLPGLRPPSCRRAVPRGRQAAVETGIEAAVEFVAAPHLLAGILDPMVSRSPRSDTPDLFSKQSDRQHSSPSSRPAKHGPAKDPAIAAPPVSRHILPHDLPAAIKQLTDQELERLVAVAVAEQRRRFGKPSVRHAPSPNKRRRPTAPVSLTPSKLNAVRAAFKAGVKPSQIARQFGLSRPEVQSALARE